jgi:GntR family transcriptional regulator, transcriptional repressor for pyruvate dehydrogenase complex
MAGRGSETAARRELKGAGLPRRKLSDLVANDLRRSIARELLQPGDRLPNEKALMQHYSCAKGTVREALKALEVQGLVKMQTGPYGGAEIQPVSLESVTQQLRTFLHFQNLSFQHVYALRHDVEVTLAASAVGRIGAHQLALMETNTNACIVARQKGDHIEARRLELEFHDILTEKCDNPLLIFICRFLNGLLRDLVEFRSEQYDKHEAFGHHNIESHKQLVDAFRMNDRNAVIRIMSHHMGCAEKFMRTLDASLSRDLLR